MSDLGKTIKKSVTPDKPSGEDLFEENKQLKLELSRTKGLVKEMVEALEKIRGINLTRKNGEDVRCLICNEKQIFFRQNHGIDCPTFLAVEALDHYHSVVDKEEGK